MTSPENSIADDLHMPAKSAVEVLGYRIPVQEDVTLAEYVEVQELMVKQEQDHKRSDLAKNLELLALFIRHRLGELITSEELMKHPVKKGELVTIRKSLEELLTPLAESLAEDEKAKMDAVRAAITKQVRLIGAASKANSQPSTASPQKNLSN